MVKFFYQWRLSISTLVLGGTGRFLVISAHATLQISQLQSPPKMKFTAITWILGYRLKNNHYETRFLVPKITMSMYWPFSHSLQTLLRFSPMIASKYYYDILGIHYKWFLSVFGRIICNITSSVNYNQSILLTNHI